MRRSPWNLSDRAERLVVWTIAGFTAGLWVAVLVNVGRLVIGRIG